MTMTTSRRGFLKAAAATGAVLLIGMKGDRVIASGTDKAQINPFIKISADGRVTAIVKHFEKGQGPATGLSTLIAEEIGVTMDQMDFEFAPSNPELYANSAFGQFQGTGGSTAMANSFMQYRTAGAAAREMLITAAAQDWGKPVEELDIVDGMIVGGGNSASIGDYVAAAAELEAPAEPRLKSPSEWRLIGNPDVRRLDSRIKGNGEAVFGMDLHLPNQMIVMLARPLQMGALVASFDDSDAKEIKGFIRAAVLPNNAAVAGICKLKSKIE